MCAIHRKAKNMTTQGFIYGVEQLPVIDLLTHGGQPRLFSSDPNSPPILHNWLLLSCFQIYRAGDLRPPVLLLP